MTMRSYLIGIVLAAGLGYALGPISLGLEADASTRYLRRGFARSVGSVGQGSAWLALYGVEASVWANMPLADRHVDELDPGLGYRFQYGGLDLDAKAVYYSYPQAVTENTVEATLTAIYTLGPGVAHTFHAIDFWKLPGAYYGNLGLDVLWPILPILLAGPGLNVGWASAKFSLANMGPNVSTLLHTGGTAAIIFRPIPFADFRLHGAINTLIPAEVRRAKGKDATTWNAGLGLFIRL